MDYLLYNLDTLQPSPEDVYLLDAHELKQYAKRGEKYLLTRSFLKKELARRSGVQAQDIRFAYNEYGKPIWAKQHFNISHSENWLCLAFHHKDIGVDIQKMRSLRNMQALASRIMSPQQIECFQAAGSKPEDFFYCWCIAEALVKLHGSTIWNACNYPFIYTRERVFLADELANISIQLFSPAAGFCGAIATRV